MTDAQTVLTGSRSSSYRYEILDGDSLLGYLDGVQSANLSWAWNAAVKGTGDMVVTDLEQAGEGLTRIADVDVMRHRIRPVLLIEGLPDLPLGVYVIAAAPGSWTGTGRTWKLQLLDKTTVLSQDAVEETFTADPSKPVLGWVADLVTSVGETITTDGNPKSLSGERVWAAGTSKLTIVNELLDVIGYTSLTIDGNGDYVTSKSVRPADRPIRYAIPVLAGIDRELIYGDTSIYLPDWSWDKDQHSIPNKVISVSNAGGSTTPLTGEATNEDPSSPYSYQARGRWIVKKLTGVDVSEGTEEEQIAALVENSRRSLLASSAPQASVQVKHLPIPVTVGDVVRFEHTPAGIDAPFIVTSLKLACSPTGFMTSTLQEVIDL